MLPEDVEVITSSSLTLEGQRRRVEFSGSDGDDSGSEGDESDIEEEEEEGPGQLARTKLIHQCQQSSQKGN